MKLSRTMIVASLCVIGLGVQAKSTATTPKNEGWTWGLPNETPVASLSSKGVLQLQSKIQLNPAEVNPKLIIGTFSSYPATVLSQNGLFLRSDTSPYSKSAVFSKDGIFFSQNAPARVFYNATEIKHGSLSLKYILNDATGDNKTFAVEKGDLFTTGRVGIGAPAVAALYVGGDFVVKSSNDSASAPDFMINNNGYISIGTDKIYQLKSEQFKVSVNGKIACKEIKVNSKWADYVFADNYTLRPLAEVERFIAENKHLPDVPSAATVESEGLALGAMQAVMMQKIEELTLYMIKIEKDNDLLRAELSSIKEGIK